MPDINITVAHKVAVSDTQSIVCDNSDYTVHWTLDEDWSAYDTKTMRTIYMDGTYEDTVFNGDTIALPVCTVPGAVQIGLFAGNLRTSRVAILRALPSVRSAAGAPADPTPDVYDQLMEIIKGLGGVDPDDIAKAVADYLAAHPIEETDPTVPAWAKAETKPTYTAAEVGAIAQSDLQVATNAALALAKSSGEFDGAPGENGADGAPGIYYGTTQPTGDTHPVWIDPNGMPDELDLSLGITGATVGQLARIKAVDASGVPTAWSPVDMPTGGETWEKIVDASLAEAVESATYTFDNCKRIKALIVPALPTGESVNGWKLITVNNVSYPVLSGALHYHEGLCVEIDSEYPPYAQASIGSKKETSVNGINGGGKAVVLENIAPNGVIEFGCKTAGLLKAGTKIEIWGVKS